MKLLAGVKKGMDKVSSVCEVIIQTLLFSFTPSILRDNPIMGTLMGIELKSLHRSSLPEVSLPPGKTKTMLAFFSHFFLVRCNRLLLIPPLFSIPLPPRLVLGTRWQWRRAGDSAQHYWRWSPLMGWLMSQSPEYNVVIISSWRSVLQFPTALATLSSVISLPSLPILAKTESSPVYISL